MSTNQKKFVEPDTCVRNRQAWMSTLARAPSGTLAERYSALSEKPGYAPLRAPEIGLVMTRGRAGGTGAVFNLGEMTVTRAAVRTDDGVVGIAYVAGRDKTHAEQAAVVDAMMQTPRWRDIAAASIVAPLAAEAATRRGQDARKVAATKVEFFTMVRDRVQK